jgi:hypothetical protein
MMDGPMTITMDLHQQILAQARDTVLQDAADATQELARSSDNDVEDAFNDGLTECHDAILALRATPAPVLPAVRIAELEAALKSLCNEVHSLEVFEHDIRCGIGNTNFACIQNALVNARAALSTQYGKGTG